MGTTQRHFNIGGMSCSFCAESIKKAYQRTNGIKNVEVSLAHEELLVRYDDESVSEVEVKDTLRDLGYTIRDPDKQKRFKEQQAELAIGKRRLLLAGGASILTAILMVWMFFGKGSFESQALWMDLFTLCLAVGTMFGPGRYIFVKAYYSIRRRIFNQHVLLEAGAAAGFVGGFLGLFVFPGFPTVHFFAVSVFITTYHILSEYTSLLVRTRASQAIQNLLDLQPDTARRITNDGDIEETATDKLEVGDRIRVNPGETIPIDGTIIEGESTVDESVATGESIPAEKTCTDEVIGGSINETGTLLVEVTATGEDAFLNQIAREIEQARAMKPGIVQLADRVLKYFVPGVLTISVLAFLFWLIAPLLFGGVSNVQRGTFAALAVLVLGYPCALGMATPLALIRGGGTAASRGILMRSGSAFQIVPDIDHIVFDKTGTLTVGEPTVSKVNALNCSKEEVLATAASAEAFSEHSLADAILDHTEKQGIEYTDPDVFESITGKGVKASIEETVVLVGKADWLEAEGIDITGTMAESDRLQRRGLTVSGVVRDNTLIGLIGIGDELKADSADTIKRIEETGVTPVMLTGDNERTARAVAEEVGIERVLANVLPEEKRDMVGTLQNAGHRVAMVGDGINDAPALTQADIGIAIGAGTDIAIESADIVLMGEGLGGVVDAYEIGGESYLKTRQNLIAAFTFNGVGVAAATTGLVHPVFAMLAMILSVSAILANSFTGQILGGDEIHS